MAENGDIGNALRAINTDSRTKGNVKLKVKRTANYSGVCSYPNCSSKHNLRKMERNTKYRLLKTHLLYISSKSVVCAGHYSFESWLIDDIQRMPDGLFTATQIEDMIDLLRLKEYTLHPAIDLFGQAAIDMKRITGLTSEQFTDLLNEVPSLYGEFRCDKTANVALFMYLRKMRLAQSLEEIGKDFNVSAATVSVRLRKVRTALMNDFVPKYLQYTRSREDLASHNTTSCRTLFCSDDPQRIVLICDGTYIFIDKSTNYKFQHDTYTDQKKRNFVKFMMTVASDGTIVDVSGPFRAAENDASILLKMDRGTSTLRVLQPNDVLVLDRGFRDCVEYFKQKGIDVKMPSLIQRSQNKVQLTTEEANKTRLITATRFVVETRNGHMKTVWRVFNGTWNPNTLENLKFDFRICAALLNKYYTVFEPNKGMAQEISQMMLQRLNLKNDLTEIVESNAFQKIFKKIRGISRYFFTTRRNRAGLDTYFSREVPNSSSGLLLPRT